MTWMILILLIAVAALLEIAGGIVLRQGRRTSGVILMITGIILISCYGLVVNLLPWTFSSLMCVYIAVFALMSMGWRRFVAQKEVTKMMWLGTALVVLGGAIVAAGGSR